MPGLLKMGDYALILAGFKWHRGKSWCIARKSIRSDILVGPSQSSCFLEGWWGAVVRNACPEKLARFIFFGVVGNGAD